MARLSTRFQHRHNLHVRRCDLANAADFADFQASMDTVVCLNVLEHIEDDMGALVNIFSALAKGGRRSRSALGHKQSVVFVRFRSSLRRSGHSAFGHFSRSQGKRCRTGKRNGFYTPGESIAFSPSYRRNRREREGNSRLRPRKLLNSNDAFAYRNFSPILNDGWWGK